MNRRRQGNLAAQFQIMSYYPENIKMPGVNWRELLHPNLVILDPDGWRTDNVDYETTPITYSDYQKRLMACTIGWDGSYSPGKTVEQKLMTARAIAFWYGYNKGTQEEPMKEVAQLGIRWDDVEAAYDNGCFLAAMETSVRPCHCLRGDCYGPPTANEWTMVVDGKEQAIYAWNECADCKGKGVTSN